MSDFTVSEIRDFFYALIGCQGCQNIPDFDCTLSRLSREEANMSQILEG